MSLGDMSGPQYGMSDGTTLSAQAATESVAPLASGKRRAPFTSQGSDTHVDFCHETRPRVTVGSQAI